MKTKEYKLLIDYCVLKKIPFSHLDKEERDSLVNTLDFELFVLAKVLRLFFCSLGFHKWKVSYYIPSDFKGYYSQLVWASCERCKYCKKTR